MALAALFPGCTRLHSPRVQPGAVGKERRCDMAGFVFRSFLLLVFGLFFGFLSQLIPALFWVAVWGTRAFFEASFRVINVWPDRGIVIMFSATLWAGIAMLFLPVLMLFLPLQVGLVMLGGIGGLWGLCTGYQATVMWRIAELRTPDADPGRIFNMPRGFYRQEETQKRREPTQPEDLFKDGIILGESPGEDEKW